MIGVILSPRCFVFEKQNGGDEESGLWVKFPSISRCFASLNMTSGIQSARGVVIL